MSDEKNRTARIIVDGPVQLEWDEAALELVVWGHLTFPEGSVRTGHLYSGNTALQLLRAFRRLSGHVDEDALEARTKRSLQ